jgi:uncharacterized protein YkwD
MIRLTVVLAFIVLMGTIFSVSAQNTCNGMELFTSPNCSGDAVSRDEAALFELINKYRKAQNKSELRLSTSLSMLANRRMLDLKHNVKKLSHSWSNCPYLITDEKTWPCVIDAPQRLKTGYTGQGYETLYRTAKGNADPDLALTAWKKSSLHNSIILNLATFKDLEWNEFGVAIDGEYAALWFGCPKPKKLPDGELGLGVSFDEAVEGLTKVLDIDRKTAIKENTKWVGTTADKKLKLELLGRPEEIKQAGVRITIRLDQVGALDPQKRGVLIRLLENLFPEWTDAGAWLDNSSAALSLQPLLPRTKLIRKIEIQLSASGKNSLILFVKPSASKSTYFEVF